MLGAAGQNRFGSWHHHLRQFPKVVDHLLAIDPCCHFIKPIKNQQQLTHAVELVKYIAGQANVVLTKEEAS